MEKVKEFLDIFFFSTSYLFVEPMPVTTTKTYPIVSAMAYDWNSKLLYMTSIVANQILVVRLNSTDFPQRVLVNDTNGVHGIALDPFEGYVNYSILFMVSLK